MGKEIEKIKEDLNNELFPNIHELCLNCHYGDCKGIIHIIDSEVNELVNQGAEIVRINDRINLLNTFKEDINGNIDLSQQLDKCRLRNCKGDCKIQQNKPIFCILFPFMIVNYLDGKKYWAISKKCLYYDYLVSNSVLEDVIRKFKTKINSMSPQLYSEITESFITAREVIHYVYGDDEVLIIDEI